MKTQIAVLTTILATLAVIGAPPANDNFANATAIVGPNGSIAGTTVDATRQVGEPQHYRAGDGSNSIWYVWMAPEDGAYGFDTLGSGAGCDIAIYSGSSLASLRQLCAGRFGDEHYGLYNGAYAYLHALKNSNYYIAVVNYMPGLSGVTKVSYYQDNLSGWLLQTHTNRQPYVGAKADGSLLWDDVVQLQMRHYRTNQFGFKAYTELRTRIENRLSYIGGDGVPWFSGAMLPGAGDISVPIDRMDNRLLVRTGSNGVAQSGVAQSGVALYSMTKGGFRQVGAMVASNMMAQTLAAMLTKKGVAVVVVDGNGHNGIVVYDDTLAKRLWSIPTDYEEFRMIQRRTPGFLGWSYQCYNDMAWAVQTNATDVILHLYKKGKKMVAHTLAKPGVGKLEYAVDAKGGVLYWTNNGGNQGPVTYRDKKGTVVVDNVALPGIAATWRQRLFTGLRLYTIVSTGNTNQIACFSIGKVVAKLGEQTIFDLEDFVVDGTKAYAIARTDDWSGDYYGLQQFDAAMLHQTWNVPTTPCNGMWYVGGGVWCQMRACALPPLLDLYIDVCSAKGPIRSHTIHTIGE